MTTAQLSDFPVIFRVWCNLVEERLAEGVSGVVFWDVSVFQSSPEYPANFSAFRQQHRGFAGGGFGSIIGRNSFQRPKPQAIALLRRIMEIYAAG